MRYSKYFIPTYKETPAEAEVISHQLMLRAGMIRKLTSGHLHLSCPAGLRALRKVENIIREEMNRAGAIEVLMPCRAAGGTLAGERPLGILRHGAPAVQGPPQPGSLPRPHPRGGHHRPGAKRDPFLPAAAR